MVGGNYEERGVVEGGLFQLGEKKAEEHVRITNL